MKNLIKHLPLLVLIFVGLSYTACTSENVDEPTPDTPSTPSESPEDNLPEEARAFVGYWDNDGTKGYNWLFFADGVCWGNKIYDDTWETGYWTYNPATTILATTIGNWQWTVTLSNSEYWTGISTGSSTNQTFKRIGKRNYILTILRGYSSWKDSDGNTSTIRRDNNFLVFYLEGTININNVNYMSISEDDNPDDYTFNYELWHTPKYGNDYTVGGGTVTLLNPTKSTGHKLVFTGTINKTLSRAENE